MQGRFIILFMLVCVFGICSLVAGTFVRQSSPHEDTEAFEPMRGQVSETLKVAPDSPGATILRWELAQGDDPYWLELEVSICLGDQWISDVYNYTQRPADHRPVLTEVQRLLDLCWVEFDGVNASCDGDRPNTDGHLQFTFCYSGTPKILEVKCDITSDSDLSGFGVALTCVGMRRTDAEGSRQVNLTLDPSVKTIVMVH